MRRSQMDLVWLAVVALSFPVLSECDPLYIMLAPSVLRVGTPENVVVEIQDYAGNEDVVVRILVQSYPSKNIDLIPSTSVVLTKANNYQAQETITIQRHANVFDDTSPKQYVNLKAIFPGHSVEEIVLVSFQLGYLFIQTDKTLYTPDTTVQFRVFALSNDLQAADKSVSVEIMTPGNIIIKRNQYKLQGGRYLGAYKLDKPTSIGIWKIFTKFEDSPMKNFSASFEVKEYVLPTFEIKLTPSKSFFQVDDKSLDVEIEARYLFDQAVTGMAYVVFGVLDEKNNTKRSLPDSFKRIKISDGIGTATLMRSDITAVHPIIEELVTVASLYISVTVMTSSGSEMVEAKRGNIRIASSPYTIQFKRTPQYFKPGMPFDATVYVTNPDGTPVEGIMVKLNPGNVNGLTDKHGYLKSPINTAIGTQSLTVTAVTEAQELSAERQATQELTVTAYETSGNSGNILHIDVVGVELTMGKDVEVRLHWGRSKGMTGQDLTCLVVSRGKIISVIRPEKGDHSILRVPVTVTKDMFPSFRLVAYYHVGATEVVSDSVWIDVADTCIGTLNVVAVPERATYTPADQTTLSVTGDPGSWVGLVAVDKGVYVLNNKGRLSQSKVWEEIEKLDPACSPGGGKNSMGVFSDAGLMFLSHSAGSTPPRYEHNCPSPPKRSRRHLTILDYKQTLVGNLTGVERECCTDGMTRNSLDYSCARRAEYIMDGEACVRAFLHCCENLSRKQEEMEDETLTLARSADDDSDFEDADFITARTRFPEIWMWEEFELPNCPGGRPCPSKSVQRSITLKDSITTWVITAVSLSKSHGLCIAEPYEMVVAKDFFIDVKLPYSVVRSEQVEIKVILYNNLQHNLDKVKVEIFDTKGICSAATNRKKFSTIVSVSAGSSRSVPYVIVPMALGEHTIEVLARSNDGRGDAVHRKLKVVTEGVLTETGQVTTLLNPSEHGGIQRAEFIAPVLPNQVPGTESKTYIAVTGSPTEQMLEKALSGNTVLGLIRKPGGCGEQNLMKMAMPVIATRYLDETKQWGEVGPDRRTTAIEFIQQGYATQLGFRNPTGAFVAYNGSPPSTWLTAYAAKIFNMARNMIVVKDSVICDALRWLVLNAQLPNGVFTEGAAVYSGAMLGKDMDVSMTAYVLITMQEGEELCTNDIPSLKESMNKATEYLERQIQMVTSPFAATVATYALVNAGKTNIEVMSRFASADGSHWPIPGEYFYSLEATSYALMIMAKLNKGDSASPIMKWLSSKQTFEGGYSTSRATVIVFQAMVAYLNSKIRQQKLNLNVLVKASSRDGAIPWTFESGSSVRTRTETVKATDNLVVEATGVGEGVFTAMTLYYAKPTQTEQCRGFELTLSFEEEDDVSHPDAKSSYKLVIEVLYLSKERAATMSIVDISIPTGFIADKTDLRKLTEGRDKYIQKFEEDKELSERGSLLIYLDKISNERADKIAFRMHNVMETGLIQPAGVTVYEYYAPDKRCTKYYSSQEFGEALKMVCFGEVCRCAEGKCTKLKTEIPTDKERLRFACTGIDYVYKGTLVRTELSSAGDNYIFHIDAVLTEGTEKEVEGKERVFTAHPVCRNNLNLGEGKAYLLMGSLSSIEQYQGRHQYGFTEETWVEYWPTSEESQMTQAYRERYKGMAHLSRFLKDGCGS